MVFLLQWVFSLLSSLSTPITWVSAHVAGSSVYASWSNAQTPWWLLMHRGCVSMCYGVYFCNIAICFWNKAIHYSVFKSCVMSIRRITAYCHLLLYLREWIAEPKWVDLSPELSAYKLWDIGRIDSHLRASFSCKKTKIIPHKVIVRIIRVIIHKCFKHCLAMC